MKKAKLDFNPTKDLDEIARKCLAEGSIPSLDMDELLANGYVRIHPKEGYVLTIAGRAHLKEIFPAAFAIANKRWLAEFEEELKRDREKREKAEALAKEARK